MTKEDIIYKRLIETIEEPFKNLDRKPKLTLRRSYTRVGKNVLIIDIPKKSKELYHSSSYTIECDEEKCDTEGTLVTKLNSGNDVKERLENFKCNVVAIHNYDGPLVKSTHIHFNCRDRDHDTTLNIAKFLTER